MLFMKLMGWQMAEGDKAASFAYLFTALGVQFDVRETFATEGLW